MTNGDRKGGWFRVLLEVIAVSAAVVSTYVALRQWDENQDLKTDIVAIHEDLDSVRAALQKTEETVAEQTERLKRSLETFGGDYKVKVRDAADSIAEYERFDTPGNRKELGPRFEAEKAKRLEKVRQKLQAFVVFVREWRPVLEALRTMINGEFDALEIDIAKGDEQAMLRRFGVIKENADSKIRLLYTAVDAAAKSKR